MTSIFEIIGATIIAGIMLINIMLSTGNMNTATAEKVLTLDVQNKMVTVARILSADLNKVGYNAPRPAILATDTAGITFLADYGNTGAAKTVQISLGPVDDAIVRLTANPNDRILFRQVTGSPSWSANVGITRMVFTYYDSTGAATTTPALVRSFRVSVTIESRDPVKSAFPCTSWQETFFIKNS